MTYIDPQLILACTLKERVAKLYKEYVIIQKDCMCKKKLLLNISCKYAGRKRKNQS